MADATTHQQLKRADVALPSGRSCGSCGSPADVNDKYCVACGSTLGPVDVTASRMPLPRTNSELKRGEESQVIERPSLDLKTFRCQNCSAEITVDPSSRSYVCPFCESTY